jgi:hypothetical protein
MNSLSEKLLDQTESFLNRSFFNKSDLKLILKAYNQKGNYSDFEDLCFTGKYLNGLFKVLEKSTDLPEVKNVDYIKSEISVNVKKLMGKLVEINTALNEEERSLIAKKYLQLTQNSIQNLKSLAEDFDDIKKYLNYLKTKSSD